jgi:hypothetical protein
LLQDILDKRGSRTCGNHLSALRDQRCTRREDNRQNVCDAIYFPLGHSLTTLQNIYTDADVCASPHIGRSPDRAPPSLPSFPSAHVKSRHDDNDNFSRARSSSLHTRPIHKFYRFQEQYSKHTLMTRHRGSDVTATSASSVGDIYQPIIPRSVCPDLGKHRPLHDPQGVLQPITPSRPFNIYRLNNETSSLEHLVSTTGPARLQDAQVLPNSVASGLAHALHTESVQYQEDNIEGSIRSISPTPATSSMLRHAASEINDSNDKKRKHKCTTCGRSWTRPSSLAIHQVKHTGLKGQFRFTRLYVQIADIFCDYSISVS